MKKTTCLLAIAFSTALTPSFAQFAKQDSTNHPLKTLSSTGPVARFDKTLYEFPDLIQGTPGTASFIVTNDGNAPLIIASAKASCGCTNLTYAKDPILPGKSATISVTYNAAVAGNFRKTITVRVNSTDQPIILQITGIVRKPE